MPNPDRFDTSIEALPLPEELLAFVRDEWGFTELHPPQAAAMGPALEGRNLLLATPTASGKSLVAYLTVAHRLLVSEPGTRAFYLVPLKALASEKVDELRALGDAVGLRVGLAIGDRQGEQSGIEDADVIVCTTEKLDSMLRNRPGLLERVSIVVVDELHLLNDVSRGPTLEVVLARLRHARPEAQRLALSATVTNADELAVWLDAKLIESDWRPVTLHMGTLVGLDQATHRSIGPTAEMSAAPADRTLSGRSTMPTRAVLDDSRADGGQLLIFVSTRASAEKEARDLSKHVRRGLEKAGGAAGGDANGSARDDAAQRLAELDELAAAMTDSGEDSSDISDRLARAVRGGVAFHHAGLTGQQRRLVEDAFRQGLLHCIAATPTLAAGINLPARRVLIRDHRRYEARAGGQMPMSVMEIHQMLGRAGRPGFDTVGEAWLMAKDEAEGGQLQEKYILGEPEPVTSKLANRTMRDVEDDPALLTHVLAAMATGGMTDRDMLGRFFDETLLARQMDRDDLQHRIDRIIDWLVDREMIDRAGETDAVRTRITERAAASDSVLPEPAAAAADEATADDALPAWASAAASVQGVVFDGVPPEVPSLAPRRRSLPPRRGPAVFGFSTTREVQGRFEAEVPEPAAMTYEATVFGETIARLYLNPVSGDIIRRGTRRAALIAAGEDEEGQFTPFSILHLIAETPDFLPFWSRGSEVAELSARRDASERERLVDDQMDLGRMKAVVTMEDWIDEKSIRDIEKRRGVQPGDLRARLDLAEWLLHATGRLVASDLVQQHGSAVAEEVANAVEEVHKRVRHGCRSELLPLVALPRIGRVRARELAGLGLTTPDDLISADEKRLQAVADLRGWSPQLVGRLVESARRLVGRLSRT